MKKILDSLSLLFPVGEKYFIQAIRNYEGSLPPELLEKAKAFYKEEAEHTRWHRDYNSTLGVDIKAIDSEVSERLQSFSKGNRRKELIATLVLEGLTRQGAFIMKKHYRFLTKGTPEPMKSKWRRHAIEEIRHTSDIAEIGHYLGVTRTELFLNYPKTLLLLGLQMKSNLKHLNHSNTAT